MASGCVLPWIQHILSDDDASVDDLSSSWDDGLLFCRVVHCVAPEKLCCESLNSENRKANILRAFEKAEEVLGYPPCAEDAQDIASASSVAEENVLSFLFSLADHLSPTLDEFEVSHDGAPDALADSRSKPTEDDISDLPPSPAPYMCRGVSESEIVERRRSGHEILPVSCESVAASPMHGQGFSIPEDDAFSAEVCTDGAPNNAQQDASGSHTPATDDPNGDGSSDQPAVHDGDASQSVDSAPVRADSETSAPVECTKKKKKAPTPMLVMSSSQSVDGTIKPQPSVPDGCCNMCGSKIFEMEKLDLEGVFIHRKCLRCHICQKSLQLQTYEVFANKFTCQHHYRMMTLRLQSSPTEESPLAAMEDSQDFQRDVQKLKDEMDVAEGSGRTRKHSKGAAPAPPKGRAPVKRLQSAPTTSESENVPPPTGSKSHPQRRSTKKHRAPAPPHGSSTSVFYVASVVPLDEDKELAAVAPTSTDAPPEASSPPLAATTLPPLTANRRRKPKAPPPPEVQRRHRQCIVDEDFLTLPDLNAKLESLDREQRILEEVAADLESQLPATRTGTPAHDAVVDKLNVLRAKKKALVADENLYVYQRMDQELVQERTHLEFHIQKLMAIDDSKKTDDERAQEEALLNEIVVIVEERNRLLDCLEEEPPATPDAVETNVKADKSKLKKEQKEKKEQEKRLEKERKEKAKREQREQKEREKQSKREGKVAGPVPNVWKTTLEQ